MKMALAESQCYTIINTPELSDIYNEMKIKKDLGKCDGPNHIETDFVFNFTEFSFHLI